MAVPLIIKAPRQRVGAVHDGNVETIDILPTIADLLGVELPWSVDGQSALDPTLGERPDKEIARFGYSKSIRFGSVLEAWPRELDSRMRRTRAGNYADGFFDVGPHVDFMGRSLDELISETIPASSTRVLLDDPTAFDFVDLASEVLPVHITGSLELGGRSSEALAFALNGVVRATATPFIDSNRDPDGKLRFEILVPRDALVSGLNRLVVLGVKEITGVLSYEGLQLGVRPGYVLEAIPIPISRCDARTACS